MCKAGAVWLELQPNVLVFENLTVPNFPKGYNEAELIKEICKAKARFLIPETRLYRTKNVGKNKLFHHGPVKCCLLIWLKGKGWLSMKVYANKALE